MIDCDVGQEVWVAVVRPHGGRGVERRHVVSADGKTACLTHADPFHRLTRLEFLPAGDVHPTRAAAEAAAGVARDRTELERREAELVRRRNAVPPVDLTGEAVALAEELATVREALARCGGEG